MKKTKPILIALVSVFAVVAIVFGAIYGRRAYYEFYIEAGFQDTGELNPANHHAENVSIYQLFGNPDKYHGKFVRVLGVGNIGFESNHLFPDKEAWYQFSDHIWLELGERATPYEEAKQYNGEYVMIEGWFDKNDRGHMGFSFGTIKNISRYELDIVHRGDSDSSIELE